MKTYRAICFVALCSLFTSQNVRAQESTHVVSASCNIYGAGHAVPSEGSGGGAGTSPVGIPVNFAPNSFVEIDLVTGSVDYNYGGPVDNDGNQNPNINRDTLSFSGISGIYSASRSFFLTGVFLSDEEPQDPAPQRLEFSTYDFQEIRPQLRQLFFIGDGRGVNGARQRFYIPVGATRLFLGFVDNGLNKLPGQYGDNAGSFTVTLHIATPSDVVEPEVQIKQAYAITFSTITGRLYQPQWSEDLSLGSWTNFGSPLAGTGGSLTVFDAPQPVSRRFYRILSTAQ